MQRGEVDRLRGMSHLAVTLYAIALRPRAADGIVRGLSWGELAREVAIAPQPGAPGESVDVSRVRRAIGALVRVGLVEAIASTGSGLDFMVCALRPTGEKLQADRRAPSPDKALRVEADRVESGRPAGKSGANTQADRAKASNGAACSSEADSTDGRSVSSSGAPPPLSPALPPITPLSTPSPHPPTVQQRASVENELPAFALTAPPAQDAAEVDESEKFDPTKTRVPEPFVPSLATVKALEQKGVPCALALAEVGVFVTFWKDAPASYAPRKRATGWQLAFINWCLKLAPKNGRDNHANPSRKLSASERNAEQIKRSRRDH